MFKPMVLALALLAAASAATGAQAQPADAGPAVPAKAALCFACHGEQGRSTQAGTPVLAGQTARYLNLQLRDYEAGRRSNALMSPVVTGMTRAEMSELATYFSRQTPAGSTFVADASKARLGKLKSDETLCVMCHLGGFAGQNEVPRVAGQNFDYIVKQLNDFKTKQRTNDAGTMTSVAGTLSAQDIENLAHYIVGL